eukprot:g499.t1
MFAIMSGLLGKAPPADARIQRVMDSLHLTKRNLAAMHRVFRRYDRDRSGTIDYEEFYQLIGEKQNVFGDSIFELVDLDNNGTLDFGEFVEATSTYCMFGKEDVLKFCFYIFDKDKNGYIEEDELQDLVAILHGSGAGANVIKALKEFDHDKDNKITFAEFVEMNEVYPGVLFPAFRIHGNMQMRIMGMDFWAGKRAKFRRLRKKQAKEEEFERTADERKERKHKLEQVRRRVGLIKFYLMPFNHDMWVSMIEEEEEEKRMKVGLVVKKKRRKGKFDKLTKAMEEEEKRKARRNRVPANERQKQQYEREDRIEKRERKRELEYGGRKRRSKKGKRRVENVNRMRRQMLDAKSWLACRLRPGTSFRRYKEKRMLPFRWGSFVLRACASGEPTDLEEVFGMGNRIERINDQVISTVTGYRILDIEWDDEDDSIFEGIAFQLGDSLLHLVARNAQWSRRRDIVNVLFNLGIDGKLVDWQRRRAVDIDPSLFSNVSIDFAGTTETEPDGFGFPSPRLLSETDGDGADNDNNDDDENAFGDNEGNIGDEDDDNGFGVESNRPPGSRDYQQVSDGMNDSQMNRSTQAYELLGESPLASPERVQKVRHQNLSLGGEDAEFSTQLKTIVISYRSNQSNQNRALWITQELLSTFLVEEIRIKPKNDGRAFTISANDKTLFSSIGNEDLPDSEMVKMSVRRYLLTNNPP